MKKNVFSKILILVLCVLTIVCFAACNKNNNPGTDLDEIVNKEAPEIVYPDYDGAQTLVAGYSYFSNKFSPFFAKTGYDQDVANMTQIGLLTTDRQGNIIYNGINGETVNYNGTDYLYTGIADCKVTENEDKTVVYDFTLRDDLFFSDGVHLTADDVIFSMYVLSDPSYDGSSTFYAQPIKGMTEYRTGVTSSVYTKYSALADKILAAGQANTTYTDFTQAQQTTYWGTALDNAGIKFTQEIIDYVANKYLSDLYVSYMGKYSVQEITGSDALKTAYGMAMWGFGSWQNGYEASATGTKGLVGEAYKTLYTETTGEDAENYMFTATNGKFYAKATSETANADLVYISDSSNGYVVTAYSGDRYVAVPNGNFVDSMGNVYDFDTTVPTVNDYWANIKETYGYDLSDAAMNRETAGSSIRDLVKAEFISIEGPKDPSMSGAITKIEGIEKTGNYSVRVTMTKFDATAIYQLGVPVAPLHYYGSRDAYKYTENKFGFTKGDLSGVKAKTTTPLGAGAYKFKSFSQGVVTFERNGYYFKGCPKITNILFKETADADKIPGVVGNTFDVSDPSFSSDAATAIQQANGNGQITGSAITTSTVDNLGYGYIGINANNVNVGDDPDSTASKNLRKAFATIFAVERETAVASYYGPRASVINYPISNTSWAAPQPADEGYEIAYSKDVNGNSIYTADMDTPAKEAAALQAAIGFFKAAGYTWDAGTGKFTAAPAGAKLAYEIIVPGDGGGDHPAFAICTFANAQLATIGITLNISDPADSNDLWTATESGQNEMWCAAWGATVDPDMYQVYYSTNIVGQGGTDSNIYGIADDNLDTYIMNARESANNSFRKATYKDCLEIILDWGVEIPFYQRQNAVIFNNSRVKYSTVTPDITTFWGWMNDIENLEMN